MDYLHTMIRIRNIEESLDFYCTHLGLQQTRQKESKEGRFTLIFLATPRDAAYQNMGQNVPEIELTYNWDGEKDDFGGGRNFGHLAFAVDDIYATCARLQAAGITINRPPRDGHMAFVKSPDGISIELLQKGDALPLQEPWQYMPNQGSW